MRLSLFLLGIFFLLSTVGSFPLMKPQSGSRTMEPLIGLYGETIMVPCHFELLPGNKLISTTWQRLQGTTIDLLRKDADKDEAYIYDPRFNISKDSSLLISQATLTDQGLYACTVNTVEHLWQQSFRNVVVYKKPPSPEITDKAEILDKGKLTTLGTCVAKDAMPAAEITWQKNGQPLVADGTDVIVTSAVKEDSTTGLLTTASSLQYTATREDVNASFSCLSNHKLGPAVSEPLILPVHYPTERLNLTATPEGPYIGLYGETIMVPCHFELLAGNKLISTTWQRSQDGTTIDLLSKDGDKDEAYIYDPRFNISEDSSLLISQASLTDQGLYACTVNTVEHLWHQNFRNVVVYKKPPSPEITDKAEILDILDKLTTLGTCVAKDAMPAAEITWQKNGQPLVADGTDVIVTSAVKEDSTTGLLTTASSLQYTATREDVNASFSCLSNHKLGPAVSEPLIVPVHYPTERLNLTATPEGPYAEGDVVTLKCHGDGNPPPSSYNFHLKGRMVLVNSDSYTLPKITRDSAGEYKCSLVDDKEMEASLSISVGYLDRSVLNIVLNIVLVILGLVLVTVAVVGMTVWWICAKRQQGSAMPGVKRERDRIYIPTLKPDVLEESSL